MNPDPASGRPAAAILSPRRRSTSASTPHALAEEQLAHFGVDPASPSGAPLLRLAERLYEGHDDVAALWEVSVRELASLPRGDRVALFNAKKFLCFQLAKLLDLLQTPFRGSHQSLRYGNATMLARGPYPVFDNVAAIFSANPVITRTATYLFACAEWIEDAFQGREFLHEIYSRLLNPTSIALANHIVDIEAGPRAGEYLAWNFNSGMAAIDGALSHLLGRGDIVIASRNVYGGTHQLLHDWFGKPSNLGVAVEHFAGVDETSFAEALAAARAKHADRLAEGRRIYVFLESPANPHGTFLDVPAICRRAHAEGLIVMLDATVGTPFLVRPLMRDDPAERPDYVIHSYTKDLTGGGTTTAGVVIGTAEDMFLPKGDVAPSGRRWDETMFWNVYYVKGAFLEADKAFEVLSGMKTLEVRMMRKCVTTVILARWLASHPGLNVRCPALASDPGHEPCRRLSHLGLPSPLFTVDFENSGLSRDTFQRFFDCLPPTFAHMVTLGQSNTVVLCPALTSHSELPPEALLAAGITPTTIRIAVGDEDPRELLADLLVAVKASIDPVHPGFSTAFPTGEAVDHLVESTVLHYQRAHLASQPRFATLAT